MVFAVTEHGEHSVEGELNPNAPATGYNEPARRRRHPIGTPYVHEQQGPQQLEGVKPQGRRLRKGVKQGTRVIHRGDAQETAKEKRARGTRVMSTAAMPGHQQGDGAGQKEKLHPMPAGVGEPLDGPRQFDKRLADMGGHNHQDGPPPHRVDVVLLLSHRSAPGPARPPRYVRLQPYQAGARPTSAAPRAVQVPGDSRRSMSTIPRAITAFRAR